MGMTTSLLIASSEIGNINAQFGVISQNIANASTPDYALEQVDQISVSAGGVGMGAVNGVVGRAIDTQVQSGVFTQNGTVAGLQTQQAALQQIDSVEGPVGSGSDIGSLLANVQNAFSTLQNQPDNATQQQQVVSTAQALTAQINAVGAAIGATRQSAQDAVVAGVDQLNATLASIGTLSDQIVGAKATGQSTAALENQRDAAMDSLSHQVSVTFTEQPNGDMLAVTAAGLVLPIHGPTPAFTTASATMGASVYAPGDGVPGIMFGGRDVTAQLTGGQIGANVTLRDQTLPAMQANLDEFAFTLSSRFAAQGLTLFTDASGAVPTPSGSPAQAGYIGYANTIQVNPAVTANPADVRDGTDAVAGSATGASAFTPNPPGGPAGFTGLITRVLTYALGGQAQAGVPQPPPATSGLGPSGTLAAGFAPPADLAGLATAITGAEAQQSASVTAQLTTEQAVQNSLQSTLSAGSSVSLDNQMSLMVTLQNAYGANARVMAAVQAMWTQLLQSMP
jgi:flagellar hook-associated protein 1 FlgK